MKSATLAVLLENFFTQRLMNQRQASPHTISSYRDTFRLLLQFAQKRLHKSPARLAFEEIDAPMIAAFLDDLEKSRGITVRSRNLRLTAIRDFAIRIWPTLILSVGPPPFPRFWPFYRTVLAVKGPLRRLYLRALDGSGPFSNTFPSRGKGGGSMASTVLRRVNDLRWARPSIKVGQVELSNPETGGMRRTHLRGRENILKRQLIHVCAFNLSLILRLLQGAGTPRELRNRRAELISAFMWLQLALQALEQAVGSAKNDSRRSNNSHEGTCRHPGWR